MSEPSVVKLKNGQEEAKALVAITMMALNRLMDEGLGTAVYDLRELCRTPGYTPFGPSGELLKDNKLAESCGGRWHVHGSIKNIVLSATSGEGLAMVLRSPVAE